MLAFKLEQYDSEAEKESGIQRMVEDGWKVARVAPWSQDTYEVIFSKFETETDARYLDAILDSELHASGDQSPVA